jgi:hypothetical protein
MALLPKLAGDRERRDAQVFPPGQFIAGLMQLSVMAAAQGDRELVTHLEP